MTVKLAGLITKSKRVGHRVVDEAMRRNVIAGGSLDTALLEVTSAIGEAELLHFVEEASGLHGVDGPGLLAADPDVAKLLPAKLAERHGLLPLRAEGRTILVATCYPPNAKMLEEIGFLLGRSLQPLVALEARLFEAISRVYGGPLPARHAGVIALIGPIDAPEPALPPEPEPPPEPPKVATPEPVAARKPSTSEFGAVQPAAATEAAGEATSSPTREFGAPRPVATPGPEPAQVATAEPAVEHPGAPGEADVVAPEPPGLSGLASRIRTEAGTSEPPRAAPAEPPPEPAPSPAPPAPPDPAGPRKPRRMRRNKVDVQGLVGKIVSISGGQAGLDAQANEAWSLERARLLLQAAKDRHEVIAIAMHYAMAAFDFAAAFAAIGGYAVGWTARSKLGTADERVAPLTLPLDAPGVLHTLMLTRGRFLGPIPTDVQSRALVEGMGRSHASAAFLCPVEIRDRVVVIFYGDVVSRLPDDEKVSDFVIFAQGVGKRLEQLVLEQKRRLSTASPEESEELVTPETPQDEAPPAPLPLPADLEAEMAAAVPELPPGLARPRPRPAAEAPAPAAPEADPVPLEKVLWKPEAAAIAAAIERKPGELPIPPAPLPALPGVEPALPTMDEVFAAADRLLDNDLAERSRAVWLMSRVPEVAAAVLVARFPGPVLRARGPVSELPAPEELGPIPAALAKLGPPAARALVPLIEHRDADLRYFALLTAGWLPSPTLLMPVTTRVLDSNKLVANAACVALGAMRQVAGFAAAIGRLRASLDPREPERAGAAARALGHLHDAASVEQLIALTGHEHRALSFAATEALYEITKVPLGPNPRAWGMWWKQNTARGRGEWLLDALRNQDVSVRQSAAEELTRAVGDSFGFVADGPRPEREKALARWELWWFNEGRSRGLL